MRNMDRGGSTLIMPPSSEGYVEVDGLLRAATNAQGNKIAATGDDMRGFWRWFEGSKVVDADRRPIVVYHGTLQLLNLPFLPGTHFGCFGHANSRTGCSSQVIREMWRYGIQGYQVGRNVIPVYLKIQNPKVVPDVNDKWEKEIETAISEGHDGLQYRNRHESPKGRWSYVMFSSDQARSAFGVHIP